ncbi:MAG: hypothetical protein QM820_44955 [Minicystis sp.]
MGKTKKKGKGSASAQTTTTSSSMEASASTTEKTTEERPSARQRAAAAIENANLAFKERDGFIVTKECQQKYIYGSGVTGNACPMCGLKGAALIESHGLPPSAETDQLAALLCKEVDGMVSAYAKWATSIYKDEEERDAVIRAYQFKPGEPRQTTTTTTTTTADNASSSGKVEDEGLEDEDEDEEQDEGSSSKPREYVIGVLACQTPKGPVFIADCSGLKPTPSFRAARSTLLGNKTFADCGYLAKTKTERDTNVGRLPTKEAPGPIPKLQKISNAPGVCAAAKLIQKAIREGWVPLYLTEIWYSSVASRHGKQAESCETCKMNLQQMLCGLKEERARFEEHTAQYYDGVEEGEKLREREEAYARMEQEEIEKARLLEQKRKQELRAAEEKKKNEALEDKDFTSWYDAIVEDLDTDLFKQKNFEDKVVSKAKELANKHGAYSEKKHRKMMLSARKELSG